MTPQKGKPKRDLGSEEILKETLKSKKNKVDTDPVKPSFKSLQCEICKDVLSTHRQLVVHMSRFHSETKSLHCDLCASSFILKTKLQEHVDVVHKDDYRCENCDFRTNRKGALTRHYKELHTKKNLHQCQNCSYSSTRKENLNRHIKNIHGSKSRKFSCLLCSTFYEDKAELDKHIVWSHSSSKRYKCIICSFATTHKSDLNQHIKVNHEVENTFTCDKCKSIFRRKDSLNKHIREYHTNNGFIRNKWSRNKSGNVVSLNSSVSDIPGQSVAINKVKVWLENNDFGRDFCLNEK